ncbi:MAG: LytTR family transcriptional regulator [Clostridia bacterium]|nr:LytTR family transcriptional regulator [Clostridia bacterium]
MKFELKIDPSAEERVEVTVHAPSSLTEELEAAVLRYTGADRLTVTDEDAVGELPFDRMECVLVEDGKTYAVDDRGKRWRIRERLCRAEELLPSYFIRINKSALANRNRIRRFVTTFSGGVDAEFISGYREYVSRRCFAEIKRRILKK